MPVEPPPNVADSNMTFRRIHNEVFFTVPAVFSLVFIALVPTFLVRLFGVLKFCRSFVFVTTVPGGGRIQNHLPEVLRSAPTKLGTSYLEFEWDMFCSQ